MLISYRYNADLAKLITLLGTRSYFYYPSRVLQGEGGGSTDLWVFGFLPQHYTEPRRTRLQSSLPWKPRILL